MTTIEQRMDVQTPAQSAWALHTAILRSEALAAFLAGLGLWFVNGGSIVWLVPVLLLRDLSMLGYAAGSRFGAFTYNLVNNWTLAAAALVIGWWLKSDPLLLAGAVVLAHVGMDRALGYGLKLSTDFRDTHLGQIGRDGPKARHAAP